jgi:hypothetical protein
MADDSIFDQPKPEIPLKLIPISGPTYLKLFRKDCSLLTSFSIFMLHRTVISHKQRLGLLELLDWDMIIYSEKKLDKVLSLPAPFQRTLDSRK